MGWIADTILQLRAILTLLTSQQTLLRAGWNTVQFPLNREDTLLWPYRGVVEAEQSRMEFMAKRRSKLA